MRENHLTRRAVVAGIATVAAGIPVAAEPVARIPFDCTFRMHETVRLRSTGALATVVGMTEPLATGIEMYLLDEFFVRWFDVSELEAA